MASELKVDTIKHTNNTTALSLDTSGNVTASANLTATGTFSAPNTTIGGLKSMQVFTSSGTWTKPSGIRTVKVYVTGGGGGGGGGNAANDFSGAGGAGGTAIEIIDVSSVSTVSVTIGDGGTGRSRTDTSNGQDGGASSFGSYCTANGGYGGEDGNAGAPTPSGNGSGFGGTATGGNINLDGGAGGHRFDNHGISTTYAWSLNVGGGSFWGGGNPGPVISANTERNALVYGTGGGGTVNAGSAAKAGDGKSGIVVVEEYT